MASCEPPPPRAATTPAAASATVAARAAATPGAAAIHAAATPSLYRGNISSSPGSRFDIDTHEGRRRCNFRSEHVPCLDQLHEVAPAVPSAGRTRAKTSCCLRRRDGKECRLYTHNGTKALIRHLHNIIHPRRFARNAWYGCSCFW